MIRVPSRAQDNVAAEKLFQLSEQATGVTLAQWAPSLCQTVDDVDDDVDQDDQKPSRRQRRRTGRKLRVKRTRKQ